VAASLEAAILARARPETSKRLNLCHLHPHLSILKIILFRPCLRCVLKDVEQKRDQHMNTTPSDSDRLIEELRQCEPQLQSWLQSSAVNALWFLVDPVDALRSAKLGLSEESLLELQRTLDSLESKLKQLAIQSPVAHTLATCKGQNRATA
jgi:hypothetical protein